LFYTTYCHSSRGWIFGVLDAAEDTFGWAGIVPWLWFWDKNINRESLKQKRLSADWPFKNTRAGFEINDLTWSQHGGELDVTSTDNERFFLVGWPEVSNVAMLTIKGNCAFFPKIKDPIRGSKMYSWARDRMELLHNIVCPHHPPEETGDPLFDVREFNKPRADLALADGFVL
jgi:hypothetical protein